MSDVRDAIEFWESVLKQHRYLMSISTVTLVELTIKLLKEKRNE
ncbi:hypothetical protein LCGC14_1769380 [marine sediment metagenome]|uniref:Uncharacterized protein n=1 Tax=marine sediment metagenome TaxID=412755 RepID=A0A0F9JDN5_9ZZZZ